MSHISFIKNYETQIKENGRAVFERIVLSEQMCKMPKLKNIKFVECFLAYQNFGNIFNPNYPYPYGTRYRFIKTRSGKPKFDSNEDFIKKRVKPERRNTLEDLSFECCKFWDTSLYNADFNDLTFDDCKFINNSEAVNSSFENMTASGTRLLNKAMVPFFDKCRFKDCDLSGESTADAAKLRKVYKDCLFENVKL